MSVWQHSSPAPEPLRGVEGELLSVRITVEEFLLEDLLDALASAPFPINPEIHHHAELTSEEGAVAAVRVELPVWRLRLPDLRSILAAHGFAEAHIEISGMLEQIDA